ncbi:ribonuclease H2 subunit B [Topomyia yanbarensis]|uniref:ribonuclease H2 subunit B n=1 Tax=Topomyia yanbarensis TaxID=2498891 RepID=UPI00273ACBAD|nr:ribonuclease H2 subunit B [Topomyia yanbarensis]
MSLDKHFFIINDQLLNDASATNDSLQIVDLRNPATGKPTKYMFHNKGDELYELNCFAETNRSWFINESVCSNGRIYLPSRIDPLFLVIPYLEKNCSSKAIPLEHVLIDDDFPHTEKLVDCVCKGNQLALIADEKKAGNVRAYRYNEEKTLDWLRRKCIILEKALGNESKSARSLNFIKEEKENDRQEGEMLSYAHGIISDYLSLALSKKLATFIGFSEEKSTNKRKSTAEVDTNQIKKIKKEESIETTPIKSVTAVKKVSAKSKALAKAASGTKGIASFFKK